MEMLGNSELVACFAARFFGWRRSADRTRLRANSLLSGNLTGNFQVLADFGEFLSPEVPVPQGLLDKFPMPVNREFYSKNREFKSVNRELFSDKTRQRRLAALVVVHHWIVKPCSATAALTSGHLPVDAGCAQALRERRPGTPVSRRPDYGEGPLPDAGAIVLARAARVRRRKRRSIASWASFDPS
jgi:hypothetical protein